MTRTERRQQRKRQIIRRVFAGLCALAFLAASVLFLAGGCEAEEKTPEPAEVYNSIPAPAPHEEEATNPWADDIEALARMVWGEARGCSTTEQAAVVWCALNRFDSGDPFYTDCTTIYDIVTQPAQFAGYDPENPLDDDIVALVEDVLTRWMAEKVCMGDVGRVLPAEYLYFTGDGRVNTFRDQYQGGNTWDWSLGSPYGEKRGAA